MPYVVILIYNTTVFQIIIKVMKRTYQPKNLKRIKKFGFRARNSNSGGKKVLKRRIQKGRKSLTVTDEYKVLRKKPTSRIR